MCPKQMLSNIVVSNLIFISFDFAVDLDRIQQLGSLMIPLLSLRFIKKIHAINVALQ